MLGENKGLFFDLELINARFEGFFKNKINHTKPLNLN